MAVASTGLTELYAPERGKIEVDIVFVHGLQGHPERTWRYDGHGPAPKTRSEHPTSLARRFLEKRHKPGYAANTPPPSAPCSVYWPKDLLPQLCPEARIQTFGYDTLITKGYAAVDQGSIFSHAKDLLFGLARAREQDRDILFVAHSLGGIIVKEVLRRSEMTREDSVQNVFQSTIGVVFMGTPHRGSDVASVGDMVRRVAQTVLRMDTNPQIIRALGLDGPELELCHETFIDQWQRSEFQVKTFQEAKPLTGIKVGFLGGKVVPSTSSSIGDPREQAETISANHMDMCRFHGPNDPGFKKVGSLIQQFSKYRIIESQCSKKLYFAGMSFREAAIREPIPNTCDWFFNLDLYQRWADRSDPATLGRFLWLKGKPGAGKSTIIKEALKRARGRTREDLIVSRFFFNARGTSLECTPLGMFRGLSWHLFDQDEHFRSYFTDHYRAKSRSARSEWHPDEEELQNLILGAVRTRPASAPRIVLLIDALDECEERGAREVVRYLTRLLETVEVANQKLDICLSGRHYPTITSPRSFEVFVEDGNREDILCYIRRRIPYDIMPNPQSVDLLHTMIAEKSSGIFLWVVLVIDIVLRDVDEGKTAFEIEQSLMEVPEDLLTLFSGLINSLGSKERARAMQLIQWVLLSNTPLPLTSLDAIQVCSEKTVEPFATGFGATRPGLQALSLIWDGDTERMRRKVCTMSRGLIEVKSITSTYQILQFIHETVREFFISDGARLFQTPRFNEIGHVMILRTCAHALCVPHLARRQPLRQDELSVFGAHLEISFLQTYSAHWLLYHAVQARSSMSLPNSIIHLAGRVAAMLSRRNFDLDRRSAWASILSEAALVAAGKANGLGPHILCDNQLLSSAYELALICRNTGNNLERNQDILDSPWSPISIFQATCDDWRHPPYSWKAEFGALQPSDAPNFLHTFPFQTRQRQEREILLRMQTLVDSGAKLDVEDREGNSLLHLCSWLGLASVTQMLLDRGQNPNSLNCYGMTPLLLACQYGQTHVASLLLTQGAKAGLPGLDGYTPLHVAVVGSNLDLVDILLKAGANPEAMDSFKSTALHVAAKFNASNRVICALLHAEASDDVLDVDRLSPMQIGTHYGIGLGYWDNLRRLWGGNSTNAARMLASRIQRRHWQVEEGEGRSSAWDPPPLPSPGPYPSSTGPTVGRAPGF